MEENLLTQETRERLRGLSKSLLRLHKILLDFERVEYELVNGKVQSTGEMFRLVLDDPHFAWLRVFSGMIVAIDEFLASKTPTSEAGGVDLINQARALLRFENIGEHFGDKYQVALQKHPAAVIAHNDALKLAKNA
jgi:hypothetical protein